MRLLLADDHAMFREGLKAFLERQGYDIAGEAANGQEAVCLVYKLNPDIAVLDLGMPDVNGIEAARRINESDVNTKTVILTMYGEESFVVEAFRAGVRGYVLKAQAANDLIDCIKETTRGATYLSPGLPQAVINACLKGRELPVDSLTVRERQMIRWIAQGKTTRQIAVLLRLSPKTVEAARSRIMHKLDIQETAGLVRFAVRHHLTEP